ncbi:MAG: hypothetical protein IJU81_07045 [Bacteroidales bacterium]|nr:hypothetical protein [Bacteroidales bacterium]
MRHLSLALAALFLLAAGRLSAQESTILTTSTQLPQINYFNPACFPTSGMFYLSLPNINVNFVSPVSMNNIMQYDPERDKTVININNILDTLALGDFSRLRSSFHLIGFGFRLKNCIVTFSSQLRLDGTVGIPYGIFNAMRTGNMSNRGTGKELKLVDGSLFSMCAYAEYGLGFGYSLDKYRIPGHLTVAVKPKLLVGYHNINTVNTDMSLYTSEDLSTLRLNVAYQLMTSSVLSFNNGRFGVSDFMPDNRGFALDLGASYTWRHFEFGASILDIGGIHWRDNVKILTPEGGEGQFTFTGLDVTGLITGGQIDSNYIPALYDTVMMRVRPVSSEGEPYYQSIPTKFNLSAAYRYKKLLKAGLTFHGELYNGNFCHTTVLSGDVNLLDRLELTAGFSVIHNGTYTDWFNPGIGLNITLIKALQLFAMIDYTSSLYMFDAKAVNVYGGINLLLVPGGLFKSIEETQPKTQKPGELEIR